MSEQEKNTLWFWVRRQMLDGVMDEGEGEELLMREGYYLPSVERVEELCFTK